MRGKQLPKRCLIEDCRRPAAWAFLAVTGAAAERVTVDGGGRVRCCQPHLMLVVGRLQDSFRAMPGGGPARLRAVPLLPG